VKKAGRSNRENEFKRIKAVSGRIVEAKNLLNSDRWGRSDPYCVLKGIRSCNHLVQIHTTRRIDNNLFPQWNEDFSFECPMSWGVDQLVGLKFLVYDSDDKYVSEIGSDDFLGGADLDLYDATSNKLVSHTLELGGIQLQEAAKPTQQRRKSLLSVQIRITHEYVPKPPPAEETLLNSLGDYLRVSHFTCNIAKARNLRNADALGKSDPVCIARVVTMDGRVKEVHRTRQIDNSLNPEWQETFEAKFEDGDPTGDPAMLVFDVFDGDGAADETADVEETGDHLGSGIVALWDFETGATRRKRLELIGDSQRLERKLNREGETQDVRQSKSSQLISRLNSNPIAAITDSGKSATTALQGLGMAMANMVTKLKNIKVGSGNKRSALLFEITVFRKAEAMPFAALLRKPIDVHEEEDVAAIMDMPDWGQSLFDPPASLQREASRDGRPQFAQLRAKDKIVFIAGRIRGATGLINTDVVGKSDPYCIVEGVALNGQAHFIHRTRVVWDRLCPEWQEAFYFSVPENIFVQRLNFLVFDSDSNPLEERMEAAGAGGGGSGNDFLGRMSVDLSRLCTGDHLREDIPLTGCKAIRNQGPKNPGAVAFRRSSMISVDICVERRACPRYAVRREQLVWEPPPKHSTTRQPLSHQQFVDPSQRAVPLDYCEMMAAKVIRQRDSNEMVRQARAARVGADNLRVQPLDKGSWRHLAGEGRPRDRWQTAKEDASTEAEEPDPLELQEIELARRALADRGTEALCELSRARRSGVPAEPRSASVPALHTRFGHKSGPMAFQFASQRPHWVSALMFTGSREAGSERLARAMTLKPALHLAHVGR